MPQTQPRRVGPANAPLEAYLREINDTPLLDAVEEQELAWRIEEGDAEARDHMVRANLRLVVNLARRYTGRGLSLDDLIAEGNMGLMRAVECFDPSLGLRFSTYASYWVKQSIKRALINTGKTVRVPAYMAELLTKWRQMSTRMQEELGRAPTQEEVAERLQLPPRKLRILQKALRISNVAPQWEPDGSGPPLEELAQDSSAGPDTQMTWREEMRQVLQMVGELDARVADVLRLRFGLDGCQPRTLKEIGERLGLTRERVRQIERDGLRCLRKRLETA